MVNCHVGLRGHLVTRILTQRVSVARNLDGGDKTWRHGTEIAISTALDV